MQVYRRTISVHSAEILMNRSSSTDWTVTAVIGDYMGEIRRCRQLAVPPHPLQSNGYSMQIS
ncbi:uncharacterized protein PHACADRAFT_248158 [Phanerochaete carnosa HHB-10118-sp]|uniref:Uncharacterized protein n=1 Tax=Phanerochaete carnosa (strain HHB-10118-sp) TaxID=650164 RepID=K5WPV5_PHACS|nr:uncharacterized protein PHACADRAFT_248158 [Phanerochaete carnosa HHB-10118-sp]EKM61500.1 hypothetical protein PHACADRAFT_248158 [Phanerochaete carnosa HHB-10118-sp]